MKMRWSLPVCLSLSVLAVLLLTAAMPVQAVFDPGLGFATEVVLNRPGITYDLDVLEKNAQDLGVVVITVEPREPQDDYSYGDDVVEVGEKTTTETTADDEPEEVSKETEDSPPEENYMWAPGTYYIYKSHYDEELAVVLQDVKDTYYKEDETTLTVQGLSIVVAIQIKFEEVTYSWEYKSLSIGQEVELDQAFLQTAKGLGWGGYYEDDLEFGLIYLEKNGTSLFISSGEYGKTPDGPTETGQTYIWVSSGEGALEAFVDSDVKVMLSGLGLNGSLWDGAEPETVSYTGWGVVPKGELTPETLDWGAAITAEIDWLEGQGVLKGVTQGDRDAIAGAVGPGLAGYNGRVYYDQGRWAVNPYPGFREIAGEYAWDQDTGGPSNDKNTITGGTIFTIDLENLPTGSVSSTTGGQSTLAKARFVIALIVLPIVLLMLVFLMVFGFTRLRRNSILSNLNRKNIYEAIKKDEGIHFNGLMEELDLKPGVLSHHLNVLEKEEYVKSRQDGKYRRFFLYETKSELKIYLTTVQQRILQAVNDNPGISQSNISKKIGSSRMIVNYHLKILRDAGIVDIEKEGRETSCYTTNLADAYLAG